MFTRCSSIKARPVLRIHFCLVIVAIVVASGAARATLPESLRNAMVDVVQVQHQHLVGQLYSDALADAAVAHPKHASPLSAFARFIERQRAEREAVHRQVLAEASKLLDLARLLDQGAADESAARERFAGLRRSAATASALTSAPSTSQKAWLAKRNQVVRQAGELESLHLRVQTAAEGFRVLVGQVQAGAHRSQRYVVGVRRDFNSALERHQARIAADRETQTQAVAEFEKWYEAQKRQLVQLQSLIDEARDTWSSRRASALAHKERATFLNARIGSEDAGSENILEQAQLASKKHAREVQRERGAGERLLELQQMGKASLQKTLEERKAREALLSEASVSTSVAHAGLASDLQAKRKAAIDAIAASQGDVKAELDAAAAGVRAAQAALVERFGTHYLKLHSALAAWLERDDSSELDVLTTPVAPRARALLELARVASEEVPSITDGALSAKQRTTLLAQAKVQVRTSSHEALTRRFDRKIVDLEQWQLRYRALLEQHGRTREMCHQALLTEAPSLAGWSRLLRELVRLLNNEYRELLASMRPTTNEGPLALHRWRSMRDTMRADGARFSRMQWYVNGEAARLYEQLGAKTNKPAPDLALVAENAFKVDRLLPFASHSNIVPKLVQNVSASALAAWASKDVTNQTWRFIEGRYRITEQLGFVVVE